MFPLKKIVTSNTNDLLDDWLFADYYQPVIEVGNKVNNNEKKKYQQTYTFLHTERREEYCKEVWLAKENQRGNQERTFHRKR
jgi:hypothetical protein